jgi:hypothetical protein
MTSANVARPSLAARTASLTRASASAIAARFLAATTPAVIPR